ncbi:MAG TPA: phosphate/phosphite/phosphonate ABC transporter substrate-binding protein [Dehalococcoidia bacterium]|nr:phosphate/phosphite/phosphonate ABC transporter substrate-binding protein [Dehalococcoidia bacterium]
MMDRDVVVGAVAYDPKVVTIWEAMRDYFREAGVPTDYVLFSNYEAQVAALFDRQIDIAWNTNVAYVRCEQRCGGTCQVLAMRNTDRDFTSRLVARTDSGVNGIADLRGKRLSLGSADSAQAAILPLHYLREAGIDPERDLTLLRFDLDVGKHGDTGTSELEVLRALHEGDADAGTLGYTTWLKQVEQGTVNSTLIRSVWTSPPYCHCNFTALPDFDTQLAARWTEALLKMDYNHPRWRRLMDLEGLTAWLPGQKLGYEALAIALDGAAGG